MSMILAGVLLSCGGRNPCELYLSATVLEIDKTRKTKILTAFFGLGLPGGELKEAPDKFIGFILILPVASIILIPEHYFSMEML